MATWADIKMMRVERSVYQTKRGQQFANPSKTRRPSTAARNLARSHGGKRSETADRARALVALARRDARRSVRRVKPPRARAGSYTSPVPGVTP